MIRAILDGNYQGTSTTIHAIQSNEIPIITVFPNPTTNILYINTDVSNYHYAVLNTMGQSVINGVSDESNSISLNTLEDGFYYVQIYTNDWVKTFKVVKQ